jgi:TRAP-type mannitol/chloroaromatic compound transport system permease small subunit
MLGALICFIGFVLAVCWWRLAKQFRKYRKGEQSMSSVQFVLYCVLTFIVFGFILSVLIAVIPEFMPRPYRHQLENNPEIMFGIVFILVASYVAFQSYRYSQVTKQTKTPTSAEDVDLGSD